MIKAILFDLDGTLTLMDQEEFMKNYIGLLAPRFKQYISPDKFAKQVSKSTEVMIKQPLEGKTNLQVFFADFTKATGLTYNTLWPIFEAFYTTDFPALRCLVKLNPYGKEAVEAALEKGYAVAIAANPVMPLIAIEERIRWAELSPQTFDLIPSMESFHYCKPHTGFYAELAQNLRLQPSECIMVGNHPVEDLVAQEIGMKTFYVGDPVEIDTTYKGELSDLTQKIREGSL
ncbi:putative HAD superfamily hydrolase [Desulfitobacterium dehalogenans ATCC 51507]|uniref:Putative HAD superfamily hydrolase n=1 Tax=Desulfitobacterium dehalogenans (strain ATCC 51507 / DSM 9161 / JW/IU-DC1) TaxID=756499 RepID=I4AA95_DESDJ|nr:HAD family hydrolase [Desulfitobacterium dehalogenans]AFM00880.1 putative HAD superfamily hydrolase [Desulfitobacterium dehalogenans ATCC 51507]